MRAALVYGYGDLDQLVVADIPVRSPGPGEVMLRVDAAGVNFADILMIGGQYQIRPEFPFSPGFEGAGQVESVGPGVARFEPGDRVIATPWFGSYAERMVVPESVVFALPSDIDVRTAAAASVAFATAFHGLKDRALLKKGETLLVTGATGGVGGAAVQLGVALGAHVIAAVGSRGKEGAARDLGADDVVYYGAQELIRDQLRALDSGVIDVIFDPVGGQVFEQTVRSLAPFGRALVVGFAAGTIPSVATNLMLLKESSVVGVYWGGFREREPALAAAQLDEIWDLFRDGVVRPPPITFGRLEEAATLLRRLADRKIIGRAVLLPGEQVLV
jgi:NADPH2:quinone reductase